MNTAVTSDKTDKFMERAIIPIVGPASAPPAKTQNDYDNDLSLGSFIQIKKVWGVRKRGTYPQIEASGGYLDHISKAIGGAFPNGSGN